MPRPLVIVSGRHRPHEILLLVVSLITGIAYTIGAPPPQSIAALLPGWALHVWSAGLAVSGAIGLVGVYSRRPWSLQLEQAGMLVGAGSLVWYCAAVTPLGWRALFAGGIAFAWAAANVVRAVQIRRDLRGPR
ncbi:hypothetical protein Drose_06100 [Dactylosporangium roseum]|uniref:Integral membrane protein n=1 Tax=Dactylosporangium roseum TaxID=47989 RepID=A0ABY5ZBY4_9ACTN|nr:hypothetical protein [Dactylosporangium roseum]UWZ37844.1 hypothetical protein Drose_06100 [Dactylosporangium roseum]